MRIVLAATALAVALAAAPAQAEESRLSGVADTFMAWDDAAQSGEPIALVTIPPRNLLPIINLVALDATLVTHGFHARLVVGAGESLAALHNPAPGRTAGPEIARNILQAYAGYTIPIGSGLTVDAGLFTSHIGFETFPTVENWNYSHAFLADYSPYYQAGVRLSYSFTQKLSAQLLWLNGWDPLEQDPGFKSAGAQLAYASERVKATINFFLGPARAHPVGPAPSLRGFVDGFVSIAPIKQLEATAVIDAGFDTRPDKSGTDTWFAGGACLRYQPIAGLAIALRADLFDDTRSRGLITGAAQRLAEITLTVSQQLGRFSLRAEGRIDRARGENGAPVTTLDGGDGREILLFSTAATG